jgi:putative NADH-flavin reductase
MNKKKIAMFGVSGDMSELLASEALKRGHSITAIMHDEKGLKLNHPNLIIIKGEPKKKEDIGRYAKDHDVVIAFDEPSKESPGGHLLATRMFIDGTKQAGVQNLVFVGHAFGKWSGYGQEAFDNYKPILQAQRDALSLFKNERELRWSYLHNPEPEIGQKSGDYRMNNDILCTHLQGEHRILPKNFTGALLDEAEMNVMEFHEQHGSEE